jgi:hypothetical protein
VPPDRQREHLGICKHAEQGHRDPGHPPPLARGAAWVCPRGGPQQVGRCRAISDIGRPISSTEPRHSRSAPCTGPSDAIRGIARGPDGSARPPAGTAYRILKRIKAGAGTSAIDSRHASLLEPHAGAAPPHGRGGQLGGSFTNRSSARKRLSDSEAARAVLRQVAARYQLDRDNGRRSFRSDPSRRGRFEPSRAGRILRPAR